MGKQVSAKQLEANQRNAQRSTGPKTVEGKKTVRWNALKHGLLTRAVVIPRGDGRENQADFQRFLTGLAESLGPVGVLEQMLVEEIAAIYWRKRRAVRAETAEIEHRLAEKHDERKFVQDRTLEEAKAARDVFTLADSAAGLQTLIEVFDSVATEIRKAGKLSAESVGWIEARWSWSDEELGVMREEKELTAELKSELRKLVAEARKECRLERKAAELREAGEKEVECARQGLPGSDTSETLLRYETAMDRKLHAAIGQLERLQRQRRGETVSGPIRVDAMATRS